MRYEKNHSVKKYLAAGFVCIILMLCTIGCSQTKASITESVSEDKEFGSVSIQISGEDFQAAGFTYGDSCTLSFSNGSVYENVPFYSGYYGKTNELAIVDYQGAGSIAAARCSGDPFWSEVGCKDGDSVVVTLKEKGKYLAEQEAMDMTYSDDRADYDSDESFANFREISCENLAKGKFYRGASPVDNQHNRAETVNGFLRKNGIRYVLDLADTEKKLKAYQETEDFSSAYFMSLYQNHQVDLVGLNAAYRTESYKRKVAESLTKMIASEGPYYIHCTEGKDRTGFVCLLLECAAGCPLKDIEADYMKTYENYFGLTKKSDAKKYQTVMDNRFYDMMNWLNGVEKNSDLKQADFQKAAKSYLTSGGMSEADFAKLVTIVTGK